MVLGTALREGGDARRSGRRRSSAPRRSCRWRPAPTARTCRSPQIALERKDHAARDRGAAGGHGGRLRQRRGGARSSAKLMREGNVTDAGPPAAGLRAHRRHRSVRRRRARDARPAGDAAQRLPRPRSASSARSSRSKPVDQAAAYTDLAESYLKSGKPRRGAEADARRARDRAELRARAGPAAEAARRRDERSAEGGHYDHACVRLQPDFRAASCSSRCCAVLVPVARVDAQLPDAPDDRFAGLQWRFVRIKYHYHARRDHAIPQDFYGEPWAIDAPAAEQNLSRRLKTATAIQVEDPIVLTLDDPRLFELPVDLHRRAGQPEADATPTSPILREFLLRGGTADLRRLPRADRVGQLRGRDEARVPRPRRSSTSPKDHPVFSCFYKLDGYPQVAGLGSFMAGRTWEKGGYVGHAAHDPRRRRTADGVHQLEHRHGRRLGMVECRGVSRLHQVHGAWPTAW